MRLLRAAQRHGAGRHRAASAQRCPCCYASSAPSAQMAQLARLREALPNARDLHEAFPAIPPGRVIRCANPSSTRPEDVEHLLRVVRVRDLIDLRAPEELREDDSGSALMQRTSMRAYRRSWLRPGQLFVAPVSADAPTAAPSNGAPALEARASDGAAAQPEPQRLDLSGSSPADPQADCPPATTSTGFTATNGNGARTADPTMSVVRHNISLLDRGRYYVSLAARIPIATTVSALLTNFVNKPAARSMLLPYVNGGGLTMLYEMLLESSRPEIRQVMEILLQAAESRHAVMFFCRAGKDRTGLVAAMVLAVAGASEEQIVEDYARSDAYHRVALAGLESREELAGLDRAQFERAPPEVMRATLEHVRRRYGSLSGYLTSVGFGADRQKRLRELLTSEL